MNKQKLALDAIVRDPPEPPDALILSHQRSGTHFLQASLSSHPNIHGRGEFIMRYRRHKEESELFKFKYVFKNKPGMMNIGIVMYSQVNLFETLCGSITNFKIIHLLRDPAAVAISSAQMNADKTLLGKQFRAHYQIGETPHHPASFSMDEAKKIEKKVLRLQIEFLERLRNHQQLLTIRYENITEGKQVNQIPFAISKQLLTFLDLQYYPLQNSLIKTGRHESEVHE